jgi:chromate reductase, NAD(P)H dehydrogenase (quinone)
VQVIFDEPQRLGHNELLEVLMSKRADQRLSSPPQAGHEATRILGISGSLRVESYNRKLLQAARELAPSTVEVELWDGLKRVPPFDEDDEHDPGAAVLELRDAIARADAVLIATPQYNGSLPGQLKNALDWASRPYANNVLQGKPVAVVGASPSPSGAVRAQAEARMVLAAPGAQVIDEELALARAYEQFDGVGRLGSVAHRRSLSRLLERLTLAALHTDRVAAAA